jgi:hypothetical protein
MRKTTFIILLMFSGIYADSLQVYTSIYGTYGSYSDGTVSKSGSAYVTLGLNYRHHLTLGYDYLNKDAGSWNYNQQLGTTGTTLNFDPLLCESILWTHKREI